MARNLTRLNVVLTAITGPFARSMGSASKSIDRFGDRVRGVVMGPLGMLTGALSAGALIAGLKNATDRIDKLAKSADRLGISTQAMAGLNHAAEQSGATAEQMQASMERLTNKIQEAGAGSKEAAKDLAALGLSAKDLIGLSADQQLGKVADAMARLGTSGERTAAAMGLFGKGNTEMVNVLEGGSAGLAAMRAEAEKLGLAISRTDAAKVEAAGDAFANVGKVIDGMFNVVMARLAPFVTAVSEAFVDATTGGTKFSDFLTALGNHAMAAAKFIIDAFQGTSIIWSWMKEKIALGGSQFAELANMAVMAAQWIGAKFSAAWDVVKYAGATVVRAQEVAFAALKVPIAAFVEFTGQKLRDLLIVAASTARAFDNDLGDSIEAAGFKVGLAVQGMTRGSKTAVTAAVADMKFVAGQTADATARLFGDTATTGSATMQKLSAKFAQVSADAKGGLDVKMGKGRKSAEFGAMVVEAQVGADFKANARAAEIAADQEAAKAKAAAQADGLAQQQSGFAAFNAWFASEQARQVSTAISGASSMFGNLAQLQNTHSKKAKAIGKASAKAKIVMDTASAAMGAYTAMASIPFIGPALGAAAAAAAVIAGGVQLSNVDKSDSGAMGSAGAGAADSSVQNIGGIAAPAAGPSQALVLQGDSFSAESMVDIWRQAKERGMTISEVRRG